MEEDEVGTWVVLKLAAGCGWCYKWLWKYSSYAWVWAQDRRCGQYYIVLLAAYHYSKGGGHW